MISRKSKSKKVYENLRRRIANNLLKPLQPLNERVLAQELKISKTPIREALQQLKKEGFVENVPNKGFFVSRISVHDIREIFEVREILECRAASLAALRADREKLINIRKKHESIEFENGKNPQSLLKAGDQIHTYIFESLGNNRLLAIYKTLQDHIARIRIFFVNQFDQRRLDASSDEHKEILEALIAQDASRAEEAMRTHLRNAMEHIKRLI